MKVALIGFTKIKYMPYLVGYVQAEAPARLDLIYWDRDGTPDAEAPARIAHSYRFHDPMSDEQPMREKLLHFIKYRRFALNILRSNHYDRLIILHSTPGLTILDYLLRRYRDAYILDYRDISHENLGFYRKLIAKLANGAATVFVSSDAFRAYLPKTANIHTMHNLSPDALEHREVRRAQGRERAVLRIRFWGMIRHLEANVELISRLGNDKRFELHYHGRDQGTAMEMHKFCEDNGINNVYFHGEYAPVERFSFAAETDLVDNIYNNDIVVQNAIGNKYYDAMAMYIPQICLGGSYMGKLVSENGIGVCVRFDSGLADQIYDYYQRIDWSKFEHSCDCELNKAMQQNAENKRAVSEFFSR